jgi:hypothetical protein
VFERKTLREIFGPTEEDNGIWRIKTNKKLDELIENRNIIKHVKDHWGDPGVDGRIILRWIFRKWEGVMGTGWIWLRIGTGGGHL